MSKNQASKSHCDDALGSHSKASQRPVMPNSQPGSTSHQEETLDARAKRKVPAVHTGPHKEAGQEHDALSKKQLDRLVREVPQDAKESPNAAARARKAVHRAVHTDGSADFEPGSGIARLE